jgi:hypothetical protein
VRLDRKKYTVSAVLIALVLLLFAGTVMAQPVITTFQPDTKTAAAGETVTWTATSPTGVSYAFYIMKKGTGGAADQRVHMQWYGPSNTVSYKFLEEGTYYARVFVKDAQDKLTWQDTLSHWDVAVSGGTAVLSGVSFISFAPGEVNINNDLIYEVEPVGGEAPFGYAFYVFRDGSRVATEWYKPCNLEVGEGYKFKYLAKEPGQYQVQAFIKDATGKIVSKPSDETKVTGVSTELKITEISGSADDGTITWNVTAVGGEEPYQYAFYVYKGEARVHTQWYGASAEFVYAPAEHGSYSVEAFVKDKTGKIVHDRGDAVTFEGTVPEVLSVAFTGDPPGGDCGIAKTWTVEATGGATPYQFAFYVYEAGSRVHTQWYSASDSIIYTPTKTATDYYVRAFVKDADGAIAIADSAKVKFGGTTVEPFGISAVTLDSYSLKDFEEYWRWKVELPVKHDGADPISYCYYIYKGDTRVKTEWYGASNTVSYLPKEVGEYSVRAFAKDAKGKIVYADSEAQETRLYHYYFTFSSEGNDNSNDHGYVMASGFPVLKYGNLLDNIAHRGYSNHTSRSTVQVTLGADNTVYLNDPTAHQLKWIKNDARIQYNSANKIVDTTTELTKENYYKVVDFNNSEGVCSFKLLKDDDLTAVEFTADETKTYEFRYVSNNQDRVSYYAQNGILTLGTMTYGAAGSGPYTWTCATGKEIRFAGLRPGIPDKPGGVAVEPKARVEFWQYMIAPNLPYAEVKFRNIQSSEAGQEARFNFDWLINKPKSPVASGYDPYEQRIGLGISAEGKLYVMDSKGGKYTADDANYFNWYDLQQTAADFENNDWNTVRLQVLANGSVEMLLNGNLVYTSATGYYNVADARRGAITLEVLQVAPEGTASEAVGNASVELSDYSFGINRLVELGPSYEK